jgi:hypothetical protein
MSACRHHEWTYDVLADADLCLRCERLRSRVGGSWLPSRHAHDLARKLGLTPSEAQHLWESSIAAVPSAIERTLFVCEVARLSRSMGSNLLPTLDQVLHGPAAFPAERPFVESIVTAMDLKRFVDRGHKLRCVRVHVLRLGVRDAARELGVSEVALGEIERGRKACDWDEAERILRAACAQKRETGGAG